MTDGFVVTASVLRQYAQVLDQQAQQINQIHQALAGVQVTSDWFGKLPASSDLHQEYTSHAQAEVENSAAAVQLVDETASGLIETADSYEQTEQSITELHRAVLRAL